MVKRIVPMLFCFVLYGCTTANPLSGTSPAPARSDLTLNLDSAPEIHSVKRLWGKPMGGAITDLSHANAVTLVATSPDPDIAGSLGKSFLSLVDAKGRVLWRKRVKSPVKSHAISDDGSLLVVSNYEDEVIAMDRRGRTLWTASVTCRPIVLSDARKVLCYHDDDAEPRIAYDVFDWNGKRLFSQPIEQDILSLRVSNDERNIAYALTQGKVALIGADFKPLWQKPVVGELRVVAVSSGEKPRVAALAYDTNGNSLITVFDQNGAVIAEATQARPVQELTISPDGAMVLTYGNSPAGQIVTAYPLPAAASGPIKLAVAWTRGEGRFADYASPWITTEWGVILGFEDLKDTNRHTHLVGLGFDGALRWSYPLISHEGAYLYDLEYSPKRKRLAATTDDGRLHLFQLGD